MGAQNEGSTYSSVVHAVVVWTVDLASLESLRGKGKADRGGNEMREQTSKLKPKHAQHQIGLVEYCQ